MARAKVNDQSLQHIFQLTIFSVYAYIPTPNGLCKDDGIICNSDFGVSVQRGSFSFVAGQYVHHFSEAKGVH